MNKLRFELPETQTNQIIIEIVETIGRCCTLIKPTKLFVLKTSDGKFLATTNELFSDAEVVRLKEESAKIKCRPFIKRKINQVVCQRMTEECSAYYDQLVKKSDL